MITFAAALLLAATASARSPATALPACGLAITDGVAQIAQGGLLRARVAAGTRLRLAGEVPRELRVAPDGAFVVGVGRDAAGVLRLEVSPRSAPACEWTLAITPREWRIERVEGVPESTVNPPPEIAARIAREQAEVARARERDDDRPDFDGAFDWPLTGRVSGVFGSQRVYNGTPKSPHSGLDVAAPKGTPLLAPAPGVITFARPDLYLTGGTVLLDHGHGLSSSFLHLSRIDVVVGQRVGRGQRIGLVGATGRATGPHMHWGLNWFDVRLDPLPLLDPLRNPAATAAAARSSQ
jgi:hypothetical protein